MPYRAESGHTGEVITPWHGAAGPDGPVPPLFGRDASVARVVDTATSPDAASLILVTGPAGIGRSAVLTAVRDELAARGLTTLTLRVARTEHGRPYSVAARLSAELAVLNR
ncbi:AAA family ATPase, partial [Streptomyces sp. SID5475]|nr:AAA family ATPase [Streptomyces sp. SID5475]